MPSPIGHSLMGYCFFKLDGPRVPPGWKAPAAFILFSNLPDFHYLPRLLSGNAYSFRFPWLHSAGFAVLAAAAVYLFLKAFGSPRAFFWSLRCLLLVLMHLALDYFCLNHFYPKGLLLFWPFSQDNFTAPIYLFSDLRKESLREVLSLGNAARILNEIVIFWALLGLASLSRPEARGQRRREAGRS